MAKYGQIWYLPAYFGEPNSGERGIPEKIIQNTVCKMEFAWHPNPIQAVELRRSDLCQNVSL